MPEGSTVGEPLGIPQPIDGLWRSEENSLGGPPQTLKIICARLCFSTSYLQLTRTEEGKYRHGASSKGGYFVLDEPGILRVVAGNGHAVLYRRDLQSELV